MKTQLSCQSQVTLFPLRNVEHHPWRGIIRTSRWQLPPFKNRIVIFASMFSAACCFLMWRQHSLVVKRLDWTHCLNLTPSLSTCYPGTLGFLSWCLHSPSSKISPTRWTWVSANSRRSWRMGEPGVLQSMGSQRDGHDLVTEQQQQMLSSALFTQKYTVIYFHVNQYAPWSHLKCLQHSLGTYIP